MSVSSADNVFAPSGITGPPEVMSGFATVTGAAGGGTATLRFNLDPAFVWMPLWITFGNNTVTAMEWSVTMALIDDIIGGSSTVFGQRGDSAAGTAIATRELFVMPRMLIKTVSQTATWTVIMGANVDTVVYTAFARALRWPKNAVPEAWQIYFTAPP